MSINPEHIDESGTEDIADEEIEELNLDVDDQPETGEHPEVITDAEAAEGKRLYHAVDDLDDESTGLN